MGVVALVATRMSLNRMEESLLASLGAHPGLLDAGWRLARRGLVGSWTGRKALLVSTSRHLRLGPPSKSFSGV